MYDPRQGREEWEGRQPPLTRQEEVIAVIVIVVLYGSVIAAILYALGVRGL